MILISSIAGYNPDAALTMYGVTKTALFGLIRYMLILRDCCVSAHVFIHIKIVCVCVVNTHFILIYLSSNNPPCTGQTMQASTYREMTY